MTSLLWGEHSVFVDRRSGWAALLAALLLGIAVFALSAPVVGPAETIALLAAGLTIPVAVAKTATACGLNAIGTFSDYSRSRRSRLLDAALYAVVSTVVGGVIGFVLSVSGDYLHASRALGMAGPILIYLGYREYRGSPGGRAVLTSQWQVPAPWVRGRRAPVIWGVFLGSGLSTWMPHPSFHGLLLLAILLPFPLGAGLLALYGAVRSTPAIAAVVSRRCASDFFVMRSLELRLAGHALTGFMSWATGAAASALLLQAVVSMLEGGS